MVQGAPVTVLEDVVVDTQEGSHDKFTHIVMPANADAKAVVTEAYVMGTPVQALCGKLWIPSDNPERHPICPTCKEIYRQGFGHDIGI